jgi:hypothetical protein
MSSHAKSDFQLPYTAYGYGGQNGRVNLNPPPSAGGNLIHDSAGFSYPKTTEANFAADMLRGNWEITELSRQFFTRTNINAIQNAIRKTVYERSGSKKYVIEPQDVDEIKIVMKAMYLQYAKNNLHDITGQIDELNKYVIDWCVPRILSEVDQYHYYLKDISHMPVPLTHPTNMSNSGVKSLPLSPFT